MKTKKITVQLSATQVLNLNDLLATVRGVRPDGKITYGLLTNGGKSIFGFQKKIEKLLGHAMDQMDEAEAKRDATRNARW